MPSLRLLSDPNMIGRQSRSASNLVVGLAVAKIHQPVKQSGLFHFTADLNGREVHRLIAETESAPMNDQQFLGAQFLEGPSRFGI